MKYYTYFYLIVLGKRANDIFLASFRLKKDLSTLLGGFIYRRQ